ncbi:MAG: hypothetical protein Q9169_006063 [Polycauliona sp. 2 TL-2023]
MSSYGQLPLRGCTADQTGPMDAHGRLNSTAYALRDDGYTSFEQHSYGYPPMQGMPVGYDNASNIYCQLDNFYDLASPMSSDTKLRTDPMVTGFNPQEGRENTPVIIHIRSDHQLVDSAIARASLSFATMERPAQLMRLDFPNLYTVTSEAPNFAATGSCSPHVPMCLRLQDVSGMTVISMEVGHFRYTGQNEPGALSNSKALREQSNGPSITCSSTEKRVSSQPLPQSYNSLMGHCSTTANSYPSRGRPRTHELSPRYSPYESRQTSFRPRSSTMSSDTTNSSMPYTPQDPSWTSNCTAINGSERKAVSSLTPSPRFAYRPRTTVISSPTLIRITKIVDAVKAGLGRITSSGDGTIHSYAEPFKYEPASLGIQGNLAGVTDNWTLRETMAKRRLVEFGRSQIEGKVTTFFAPVEACTRKRSTISCILWERSDGYCQHVITSVDIIHLLEFLIDCQTDTDEKNRIRRNVDKFEAKTTYKDDPETGPLFNLIMGFPDPKPRHIAKPVKVFPWNQLATAVARAPTSQPKGLLKSESKPESGDDIDSKESPPHRPHSTSNSAHSRSQSSAYSTSGPSCASSITSPNMEPTVHGSQPSGTAAHYDFGPAPDPVEYASALYPYSRPDLPSTHVSMVAGHPVRGSWDFSGVGATNHIAYNLKEE